MKFQWQHCYRHNLAEYGMKWLKTAQNKSKLLITRGLVMVAAVVKDLAAAVVIDLVTLNQIVNSFFLGKENFATCLFYNISKIRRKKLNFPQRPQEKK